MRLLYAGVPVYWVIRSGKAKDQADFAAMAHRVRLASKVQQVVPLLTTKGDEPLQQTTSASASVSFAGGPLVIPASYASTVTSLISSAGFSDVVVYEAATVDVRHVLITSPKAILSNLSTYAATLTAVLTDAGTMLLLHDVGVEPDHQECLFFLDQVW